MFQRDYIMRMIAQAAEAAGTILGLRRRQEQEQALRFIDDWLERHLRLRLDLVDRLSATWRSFTRRPVFRTPARSSPSRGCSGRPRRSRMPGETKNWRTGVASRRWN
jgi:hypothetical protein